MIWGHIIKELRSMYKSPTGRASGEGRALISLLQQLNTSPALPRTAWKALIVEDKVNPWVSGKLKRCSLLICDLLMHAHEPTLKCQPAVNADKACAGLAVDSAYLSV